jgi:hypothetical protein
VQPDVAVWGGAKTGSIALDNVESSAKVESRTRRLIPNEGTIDFLLFSFPDTRSCG